MRVVAASGLVWHPRAMRLGVERLAAARILAVVGICSGLACQSASGPLAEAEAWQEKACACDDEACEIELNQAASELALRVGPELKTDAQRIEYGKTIALGQNCLKKAKARR
jgi:hypothetical protein